MTERLNKTGPKILNQFQSNVSGQVPESQYKVLIRLSAANP